MPPDAAVWREDSAVFVRQDELTAILIEEIGRWGRLGLQIRGVKPHDLPEALDVRPKRGEDTTPLETDPVAIRNFFSGE